MADFKAALREEEARLRTKLEADPTFQTYGVIRDLLARYEADAAPVSSQPPGAGGPPKPESPAPTRPPFMRSDTGMAAVQRASAEFLRAKGSRAASPEIHAEMVRLGLMQAGDRDRTMLTSYLSRDKATFDNVRGRGYGLREWSAAPGHGQAPRGGISAASANGPVRPVL